MKKLLKYAALIGIYTVMYLVVERDFAKEQIGQIREKLQK